MIRAIGQPLCFSLTHMLLAYWRSLLHSLPGLYLFAISNAPSMLSASKATLYLAVLLLTSMEIFIIRFFFRIGLSRRSVWLGVKQAPLPDGYLFVGHVAIFLADTE